MVRFHRIALPRSTVLAVACVVALAGVSTYAAVGDAPLVELAQLHRFEGQGDVAVEGIVQLLHQAADGSLRFHVVAGSHAIDVRTSKPATATAGAWAHVEGRVLRNANELTLWTEAAGITLTAPPGIASPSWREVAEQPELWVGKALRLSGIVQAGALRDKDGHSLAIEDGAWPAGPRDATGYIAFKAACVCYRLAPLATSSLRGSSDVP